MIPTCLILDRIVAFPSFADGPLLRGRVVAVSGPPNGLAADCFVVLIEREGALWTRSSDQVRLLTPAEAPDHIGND